MKLCSWIMKRFRKCDMLLFRTSSSQLIPTPMIESTEMPYTYTVDNTWHV